jgi:hypothetical protein
MEVVVLVVFIIINVVGAYFTRHRYKVGVIRTKKGLLGYSMGNYLNSQYGIKSFHGIDILLDKPMMHLYLDSHKDSKHKGPTVYIEPRQRISLEGNFNKYFQLFAPNGQESLALSIISPDVMHTLQTHVEKYDLEIYYNHVRLISVEKVYGDPRREQDILAAAQQIIEDIMHRNATWNADRDSHWAMLELRKDHMLKLGGRYYPRNLVYATGMVFFVALALASLGCLFVANGDAQLRPVGVVLLDTAGLMLLMTVAFLYMHKTGRFNS